MVANFFYVFYERTTGRLWKTLLAMAMTFMSLSTGPNLAQLVQLILIAWERIFRILTAKWAILVVIGGTVLGIVQLAYPGGVAGFIIETLAFNPQTGYGRLEILEYGGASVLEHPIFGIGLSTWEGPWWRPISVDNYWLLTAMRYGLPALAFMWIGIALHAGPDHGPPRPLRGGGELPQGLRDRDAGIVLRARHGAYLGGGQRLRDVLSRCRRVVLRQRRAGARAGTVPPARRRDRRRQASWW